MNFNELTDEALEAVINEMFRRYGAPSEEVEISTRTYLTRPDKIGDLDTVQRYDRNTDETIKGMQRIIEKLQLYRIALQRRYNYLATSPTAPVIKLDRRKDWYGNKVFYYLSFYDRNILDGHETLTSQKKYEGKERHVAIADFKKYVKDHPGIINEANIAATR